MQELGPEVYVPVASFFIALLTSLGKVIQILWNRVLLLEDKMRDLYQATINENTKKIILNTEALHDTAIALERLGKNVFSKQREKQ